jgi:hypothetical protein
MAIERTTQLSTSGTRMLYEVNITQTLFKWTHSNTDSRRWNDVRVKDQQYNKQFTVHHQISNHAIVIKTTRLILHHFTCLF